MTLQVMALFCAFARCALFQSQMWSARNFCAPQQPRPARKNIGDGCLLNDIFLRSENGKDYRCKNAGASLRTLLKRINPHAWTHIYIYICVCVYIVDARNLHAPRDTVAPSIGSCRSLSINHQSWRYTVHCIEQKSSPEHVILARAQALSNGLAR